MHSLCIYTVAFFQFSLMSVCDGSDSYNVYLSFTENEQYYRPVKKSQTLMGSSLSNVIMTWFL